MLFSYDPPFSPKNGAIVLSFPSSFKLLLSVMGGKLCKFLICEGEAFYAIIHTVDKDIQRDAFGSFSICRGGFVSC
jgi:hypothetical protein